MLLTLSGKFSSSVRSRVFEEKDFLIFLEAFAFGVFIPWSSGGVKVLEFEAFALGVFIPKSFGGIKVLENKCTYPARQR